MRSDSLASRAVLLASAFIITALIIVQAGRIQPAHAEMVSQVGEFTVLTTDGGNEEILYVLDKRTEDLAVYRVESQSSIELYQRIDLAKVFADARAKALGRK